MNWDQVQGNWKQLAGQVRFKKDELEREVDAWLNSLS
jgi:uncharacterized protein YjbJ (UPF0337 family)